MHHVCLCTAWSMTSFQACQFTSYFNRLPVQPFWYVKNLPFWQLEYLHQVAKRGNVQTCHIWKLLACSGIVIFGNLVEYFHQVTKKQQHLDIPKLLVQALPILATWWNTFIQLPKLATSGESLIHWTGLLDWTTELTQNGTKCLLQHFQCRSKGNHVYSAYFATFAPLAS